jgi:hypothetical protein
LVGGADASQNGLGDFIPAKSIVKSAMYFPPLTNLNSFEVKSVVYEDDMQPACPVQRL